MQGCAILHAYARNHEQTITRKSVYINAIERLLDYVLLRIKLCVKACMVGSAMYAPGCVAACSLRVTTDGFLFTLTHRFRTSHVHAISCRFYSQNFFSALKRYTVLFCVYMNFKRKCVSIDPHFACNIIFILKPTMGTRNFTRKLTSFGILM